ncbi:MAG: hypothetical protein SVG88_02160 [Halobacteriales archaeon]|nr:hypothetical protein [Halobacteriales archaeon]
MSQDASEANTDDLEVDDSGRSFDPDDAIRYLEWAGLALLFILATLAMFRFYTSAGRTIDVFVADRYESLFQAAFNLVVLLVAVTGISVLIRRMTAD